MAETLCFNKQELSHVSGYDLCSYHYLITYSMQQSPS